MKNVIVFSRAVVVLLVRHTLPLTVENLCSWLRENYKLHLQPNFYLLVKILFSNSTNHDTNFLLAEVILLK